MSVISTFISLFTHTPSRQNPLTFSSDMDSRLSEENSRITQMNSMGNEMNIVAVEVNSNTQIALNSANVASTAANYKGTFVQGVSSALIGESWTYSGSDYICIINTSNNPISEPTSWKGAGIASLTHASTSKTTPVDADELPLIDSSSSFSLKKLTWANLKATMKTYFDTFYQTILVSGTSIKTVNGTALLGSGDLLIPTITGVRQTVQSGSVDSNGYANFISIGTGLAVNIAATTVPITIHAAGGKVSNDRIGTISADTTISGLTANATNYLYADVATNGTVTLSANTVAHLEQFGGTPATTNNLITFNIGQMTGYTGNGSTAPQSWRVPIGEAVTGASTVTSVVTYALNGRYETPWIATLPSASTQVSKNHNIGYKEVEHKELALCTTIDLGYAVGDIIDLTPAFGASGIVTNNVVRTSINAYQITAGQNGWGSSYKNGTNFTFMTAADWSYKMKAWRGF